MAEVKDGKYYLEPDPALSKKDMINMEKFLKTHTCGGKKFS